MGPLWLANKCLNRCQGLVRFVPRLVAPGLSIAGSFPKASISPRRTWSNLCSSKYGIAFVLWKLSFVSFRCTKRQYYKFRFWKKLLYWVGTKFCRVLNSIVPPCRNRKLDSIVLDFNMPWLMCRRKYSWTPSRVYIFPLDLNSRSLRKRKKINF